MKATKIWKHIILEVFPGITTLLFRNKINLIKFLQELILTKINVATII